MQIIHCGITYECAVAVKCTNDKYIKLYDANGVEIAAFHNISDFSDYTISGGSFVAPCDCATPISLSGFAIGGRTIAKSDWILANDGRYAYEINNNLISGNVTTCNILLFFAEGTELEYKATQEEGKIILYTSNAPQNDIVLNSIQILRA